MSSGMVENQNKLNLVFFVLSILNLDCGSNTFFGNINEISFKFENCKFVSSWDRKWTIFNNWNLKSKPDSFRVIFYPVSQLCFKRLYFSIQLGKSKSLNNAHHYLKKVLHRY